MFVDRREILRAGITGLTFSATGGSPAAAALPATLPPWTPGTLDIHHIDTGVGNATFILAPDGTTILIDCGAIRGGPPASTPLRPDHSRSAGEWVARYARRHARAARRSTLDYIVATHVHPDHVGSPLPGDPRDPAGYTLTGLSEVDALMPAEVVIDRGFPDYAPLPLIDAPFAANHLAWLKARVEAGRSVQHVSVGSATQMKARRAGAFEVRFVGGNGQVWTGTGNDTRDLFPPRSNWSVESVPEENHMSIALVLAHGPFKYFAGGDLVADTHEGRFPWLDVETPVTRAAGPVDVASADHHGYFDSSWSGFTRALDARAYVIQGWHATHPDPATLQRLLDAWRGRDVRDVFVTRMDAASAAVNGRFLRQVQSVDGHVIVRVDPSGQYRVFVTDSRNENDHVTFTGASRKPRLRE